MLNHHHFAFIFAVLLSQLHATSAVQAADAKPKLDVAVRQAAQENTALRNRVATLQRDLESLTARERAARSEVDSIKAQLAAARAMSRDAEQIEARLNQHIASSKDYLDSMTSEVETLQTAFQRELRWAMVRDMRMSRRYRSARAKIAALEQRIAAQSAIGGAAAPPAVAAQPTSDAAEAATSDARAAIGEKTASQSKAAKPKKKRAQARKIKKKNSSDEFDLMPF